LAYRLLFISSDPRSFQIPVYGLPTADKNSKDGDPFYKMRMLLASNRGTLMELGISPIVTSGLIMQLLLGAKIIDIDTSSKEEKELYQSAKKLLGLVICVVEAVAYVLSGMYVPRPAPHPPTV
jgi:protein transport protein SEC61 subunit alpha